MRNTIISRTQGCFWEEASSPSMRKRTFIRDWSTQMAKYLSKYYVMSFPCRFFTDGKEAFAPARVLFSPKSSPYKILDYSRMRKCLPEHKHEGENARVSMWSSNPDSVVMGSSFILNLLKPRGIIPTRCRVPPGNRHFPLSELNCAYPTIWKLLRFFHWKMNGAATKNSGDEDRSVRPSVKWWLEKVQETPKCAC